MKTSASIDVKMIRPHKWIAHEAPICILDTVKKHTDYDYCLVHLLDESKEYKEYFYNLSPSRMVILDNSIFELGEAFEGNKYEHYIHELKPSVYIAPDVLGKKEATIDNAADWVKKNIPYSMMAVVQGQNMDELVECYVKFVSLGIRAIAIGFNHNFFIKSEETRDWDQANGRIRFVRYLKEKGLWCASCYHHLLGCTLPFEFAHGAYKDVNSVDTSSPVLHGLLDITFDELTLLNKKKIKVNELMYQTVYPEQIEKIVENINKFRYNIR